MLSNHNYKNAHKANIDIAGDHPIQDLSLFLRKYELNAYIDGNKFNEIEIIAENKFQLIAALADNHQTKIDDEWLLTQIK